MMLWHREHPQEEMTTLDYIPSLHLNPHPGTIAFIGCTSKQSMRDMTDAEIRRFNEAHTSATAPRKTREQEIAEAVAAERERCASIAEYIPELKMNQELSGVECGDTQGGYRRGRQRAAAAIRNAK